MPVSWHIDRINGRISMKKIKWLFVMMVFVTVGAVCIAFIVKNEKNKQAPIERYYEKNESEEDNEKDQTGETKFSRIRITRQLSGIGKLWWKRHQS